MEANYLPEFQRFLRTNRLVKDRKTQFFAYWVSRFLVLSNNQEDRPFDQKLTMFLDQLEADSNIQSWQIKQAENAITLYMEHFMKQTPIPSPTPGNKETQSDKPAFSPAADEADCIARTREAIRILHYSLRTERTYLGWIRDFFKYLSNTPAFHQLNRKLSTDDLKNYLTYLALQRKVASSTQNQALNALVFLFKRVLQIPIDAGTVRAKRGLRLPVVLSKNEVEAVFNCLTGKNLPMLQLLYGGHCKLFNQFLKVDLCQ